MHPTVAARGRAFTTIELLTVIGILVILSAIAVIAMGRIRENAQRRQTQVSLQNAANLLTELELKGPLRTQLFDPPPDPTFPLPFYSPVPASFDDAFEPSPGRVDEDSWRGGQQGRYGPSVQRTQGIMGKLAQIPANRSSIQQLPPEQMLRVSEPAPPAGLTRDATTGEPNPPVMVDGWGNPIIFVPPGGLDGVIIDGVSYRITSAGIFPSTTPVADLPQSRRAFFASAGPDGAFDFIDVNGNGTFNAGVDRAAGDDNLYSFEQ
jgi:type II secretory pathway pseudopilin PulG